MINPARYRLAFTSHDWDAELVLPSPLRWLSPQETKKTATTDGWRCQRERPLAGVPVIWVECAPIICTFFVAANFVSVVNILQYLGTLRVRVVISDRFSARISADQSGEKYR